MKDALRKLKDKFAQTAIADDNPASFRFVRSATGPSLLGLPSEVIIRIATLLPTVYASNLAYTSSTLVDVVESVTWKFVSVPLPPEYPFLWMSSGESLPAIAAGVADAWKRFEKTLMARPARFDHVHGINFPMSVDAIPIVARVLPHLPSLRQLVNRDVYHESSAGYAKQKKSTVTALEKCGPLPALKQINVPFVDGTRNELFHALHGMPNIESLMITVSLPLEEGRTPIDPPSLLHLRSLDILAVDWAETVWPLVKNAPRLQDLTVAAARAWRHERSESSDAIFASKHIRTVYLGDHMTDYVLAGRGAIPDWLPNLEILTLTESLQASCMPAHPNVRLINFRMNDPEYPTDGIIAAAPEPGSTLRLEDWVVTALQRAPKLIYIDDFNDDYGPKFSSETVDKAIETGYRVVTFTNGADTLVHIRKRLRYLIPSSIWGYGAWWARMHAWKNLDGHFEGSEWVCPDDEDDDERQALTERPTPVPIPATERDKIANESCDMTSFRGFALPCSLLDYVYEHCACQKEWDEGLRGLELPEEVWQYLDEWYNQVAANHALLNVRVPQRVC